MKDYSLECTLANQGHGDASAATRARRTRLYRIEAADHLLQTAAKIFPFLLSAIQLTILFQHTPLKAHSELSIPGLRGFTPVNAS